MILYKVELELRMDTTSANYSRSKGEQVESESLRHESVKNLTLDCLERGRCNFWKR